MAQSTNLDAAPPQDQKRRQSETPSLEPDPKRPRGSPLRDSAAPSTATSMIHDGLPAVKSLENEGSNQSRRRMSTAVDEKGRSKRLFGALMGNLNPPSGEKASKRRKEIEERKRAEIQRQEADEAEKRQNQANKLAERREEEQRARVEHVMHNRHTKMLSLANFLQTTAEPRLYYLPWDLRPSEEDIIDDQIDEAKDVISRELKEFEGKVSRNEATDSVIEGERE